MWFIDVEVEQETRAPPPKKNPGSAPGRDIACLTINGGHLECTVGAGVGDYFKVVLTLMQDGSP